MIVPHIVALALSLGVASAHAGQLPWRINVHEPCGALKFLSDGGPKTCTGRTILTYATKAECEHVAAAPPYIMSTPVSDLFCEYDP